MFFLQAYEISE